MFRLRENAYGDGMSSLVETTINLRDIGIPCRLGCNYCTCQATPQEINEAVARELGWVRISDETRSFQWQKDAMNFLYDAPDYCHSIAAAWEVVESLKDKYVTIEKGVLSPYMCSINWAEGEQTDFVIVEYADTAPMAICLAYLKLS